MTSQTRTKPTLRSRLLNLLSPKVGSSNQDLGEYRTYLVFHYTILIGVVVHLLLSATFLCVRESGLALFNLASVVVWSGAWVLNRYRRYSLSLLAMAAEVVVQSTVMVIVMGWSGGFQYYLLPGIPFILFNIYLKDRFLLFLAFSFSLLFTGLYGLSTRTTPGDFEPLFVMGMHYANIAICVFSLMVVSYCFRLATALNNDLLREAAHTDFLTGLRNRRSMMDLLEQQRRLAEREGSSFGVLILDLDHFKTFNDRYGHDCGDYVLHEVAQIMQSSLRESDVVARWGGEEFLVMTPNTDARGAGRVAEDLRAAIQTRRLSFAGQALAVTATVGVATSSGRDRNLEATLKLADQALYRGKDLGRNKVHHGETLELKL